MLRILLFPLIYRTRASRWGHKRTGKLGRKLQYGPRTRLVRGIYGVELSQEEWIKYKNLLPAQQKQDILNALRSGGLLYLRQAKK